MDALMDGFIKLVNVSISASFLALAVIALRLLLKKAPKSLTVMLWLLVALRLICPFSIESKLSLVPNGETLPTEILYIDPTKQSEPASFDLVSNPIFDNYVADSEVKVDVDRFQIDTMFAYLAWPIGVALMLLYAFISYVRIYFKVRTSARLKDNIFLCDNISSPFIFGFFRPKIYINSDMNEETMKSVLEHERAHIKRKDYLWKPLGFVILSIHWFNPIMWASYILFCRDVELACDEKVIKGMTGDEKKKYSEALLSCSVQQKLITACPVAFGEVGVKQRIKAVLSYKKPTFWVILFALIASIVVGVCFATVPASEGKDEPVMALGEFEIAAESISFYTFASANEYLYSAYDEESIKLINKALGQSDVGEKIKNYEDEAASKTLVAVHTQGESVFVYFDESFEKIWCCDVDGNYSDIYALSGGKTIKEIFEDKSFINEDAVWIFNPMLSATFHYQTEFQFDNEIAEAVCNVGTIELSEDKRSFIWSPDDAENTGDERKSAYFEVTEKSSDGGEVTSIFALEVIGWEEKLPITYYRISAGENVIINKTGSGGYGVKAFSDSEYYFDAMVLEVSDERVLVEPFENTQERKSSDKIWVSTNVSSASPVPDLYEGLYIRIVYDGIIQELYPAIIPGVSAIYLYADVADTAASDIDSESVLKKNEIPKTDDWQSEGLKAAGIEDADVEEIGEISNGKVYLISRKIAEDSVFVERFIAAETDRIVLLEYIGCDYSIDISLYDVDSEAGEEIIVNQLVGATGGAGSYRSSVLKVTDNDIESMFYSDSLYPYENGFSSKVEAPFTVRIINEFADYELLIDCKDNEGYIEGIFDENGAPLSENGFCEVMFDSFYEFNPVDADNDNIYEIECLQYSSLYGHADYIGSAKSVIKFNDRTGEFEIISAEFIPVKALR